MNAADLSAWAVEWHSRNQLDGDRRHLIWNPWDRFRLFPTRRETRAYIEAKFGYIRDREDLRREPHGWRLPRAVRVEVYRGEGHLLAAIRQVLTRYASDPDNPPNGTQVLAELRRIVGP